MASRAAAALRAATRRKRPERLRGEAPVAAVPGLYLTSGFSGHGFGIGAAVGATMAALIQGNETPVDIRPFRLKRYA